MSQVRTKAYTLNRLISEVGGLNSRQVTNFSSFVQNLSPRTKGFSAKYQVLNTFLNGKLKTIANDASYGRTVKARVLKALRARKRYGSDFTV